MQGRKDGNKQSHLSPEGMDLDLYGPPLESRVELRARLRVSDPRPEWRTAFARRAQSVRMRARVEAYWGRDWERHVNTLLLDRLDAVNERLAALEGQERPPEPVLTPEPVRAEEPRATGTGGYSL